MKRCPECGTENKEEYRFCKKCGAALEPAGRVESRKRFCPKCGREIEEGDRFCSSCGSRINEISIEKASIGERFISYVADIFPINLLCFFLFKISNSIGIILWMVLPVIYFTYFFGKGQTPGMELMNIELCTVDGERSIGYKKGFLRSIGMIISSLAIGVGFLWILIDKNKQGWHDKIAGTIVVKPIYATDSSSLEGGEYEAF